MKYKNEVIINQSLDKVIGLFDSEENLYKWQPGLVSCEHLSGEKGHVGAKSRLKYMMGNREVEMIETITAKDLPGQFDGTYQAKGVWNEVRNSFISLDAKTTKWTAESHFEFSGFMKIIAWLMPGSFKKQSQKYMDLFKAFAEEEH